MILSLAMAVVLADGPRDVQLAVKGGSLFKNGYAVVMREASIPASGEYVVKDVPQAGLGTFWLSTTPGTHLEFFKNEESETSTERSAATLDEIIALNKDKVLEITVYNQSPFKAKILSADGQIIVYQIGDEIRAINMGNIVSVRSSDKLVYRTKDKSSTRVLHFKVVAGENAKVRLMTLERGLSWSPAYYVDITDPKFATIVARCTLVNDLSELKDVPIRLVTGFPNFQHANMTDPMSFFQTVVQTAPYYQNAMGQFGGFGGGGANLAARSQEVQAVADAFAGGALPGGGNEDLFYYDLPHVTMAKSDRVYQPLYDTKSQYEHRYTLDIEENQSAEPNRMQGQQPLEVWHTIVFQNPLSQPLTTAPAMVVSKGEVLSQSTVNYTPVGSECQINLTKALDVPAEIHEEEVNRVQTTVPYRTVYDVTVKGKIRVQNRKTTPIHLKISKRLMGDVKEIGQGGKSAKLNQGLSDLNPRSSLQWDTTLEGNKTLDLTYTYTVKI